MTFLSALRSTALVGLLVALASGCSVFGYRIRSPITREAEEVRFGPGKLTAAAVQSEIMSFTDTFDAAVAEQWNRIEADARATLSAGDEELSDVDRAAANRMRRAALENKLATVSAALSIASSPNPTVALADMITMVTLQRMVVESPVAVERFGEEHAGAMAELYREQEAKVWRIGTRAMSPKQQEELKNLIAEWREANPDATYVANVRLEDFARNRQQAIVDTKKSGDSLLSLVALDPLAGLEPAQREVLMSRMFAERMFFYGTRMPQVLKWQVESLSQSLLRAPELTQALSSIDEFTESAQRIASVTERLPETQDKFQDTLREFRDTVQATNDAAATLTTAIHAADGFAARFQRDKPSGEGSMAANASDPARGNGLAKYQAAVAQTGDAADRLTVLAKSLDRLLDSPALTEESGVLQSTVVDVQSRAESVINYAFMRLLAIALVVPFAVALAIGLYRRTANRRQRPVMQP